MTPEQKKDTHVCIGTFRPTRARMVEIINSYVGSYMVECPLGHSRYTIEQIWQCWADGCYDEPIYRPIEPENTEKKEGPVTDEQPQEDRDVDLSNLGNQTYLEFQRMAEKALDALVEDDYMQGELQEILRQIEAMAKNGNGNLVYCYPDKFTDDNCHVALRRRLRQLGFRVQDRHPHGPEGITIYWHLPDNAQYEWG